MYNNKEALFLRNLIVGANTQIPLSNGEYVTAINFDNAATTPPFFDVLRDVMNFAPWYSSIHRGNGHKSLQSSKVFEEGRDTIKKFVNAVDPRDILIYTKNTTESINILSYKLYQQNKDQVIISTDMEHLANELPWRNKFKVDFVVTDNYGVLTLADLENKLRKYAGKVGLVTVTGASNVTGHINPINKIAVLAHQYGAKVLVDGAQLVPHASIDMKGYDSPEHIDYLAFSAHKMYAPFGIGVLIGPKDIFSQAEPVYKGGGDVRLVSRDFIEWHDSPAKDEAGTPNILGIIALLAAISTINRVGMRVISEHERHLINYLIAGLQNIPGVVLYGHRDKNEDRVSLISFNIEGIYHQALAAMLSMEAGIAVRSGLFCAHPYVESLLKISREELDYCHGNQDADLPGMVRVSLGLYNNYQEIDTFLTVLNKIARNKKYYIYKYQGVLAKVASPFTEKYQ